MPRLKSSASILLISLMFSSCRGDDIHFDDEYLRTVFELYMLSAPNKGAVINLQSVRYSEDMDPDTLGVCRQEIVRKSFAETARERKVLIRPSEEFWTTTAVVIHELGHCVHGLRHTENPEDIMFPHIHVRKGETREMREKRWEENLLWKIDEMWDQLKDRGK